MKIPRQNPRSATSGFTLVEVMISMAVCVSVLGMAMSTFLFGLRTMYKDTIRIQTNGAMRFFTAQMAKETVDASEFYLFPDYTSLDGSVDIAAIDTVHTTNDLALVNGTTGLASGDCIVLVSRTSLATGGKIKQIRVYFRTVTAANVATSGSIRYYEGEDYDPNNDGTGGSSTALTTLLNAITLSSNIKYTATNAKNREITSLAKGRKSDTTSTYYPMFCSDIPYLSPANQSFSINVEFIQGVSAINMVSSSSFNYTVSPRR